jgi:hypothetical protein
MVQLLLFLAFCSVGLCDSERKTDDPPYTVGQYAEGGVIFWIDPSGSHGLVAAITDQDGEDGIIWYNGLFVDTKTLAAGVYLGALNTQTILAVQGTGTYAASLASSYSVTVGDVTYTGWYLPSLTEANMIFQMESTIDTTAVANGGTALVKTQYWTSNENSTLDAWGQDFNNGGQNCVQKNTTCKVRAIRSF